MAQSTIPQQPNTNQFMMSAKPTLCPLCGQGYARPVTGICGPCHIRFINDSNTGSRRQAQNGGAK